jgi:hypothetical protein
LKLEKFCIFCGGTPKDKTKEHVIPQWLIKMTGNPKRKARFGISKNLERKQAERQYAFDAFTFPACDLCNQNYAKLEGLAKNIVEKLLKGKELSTSEISILMDWFDKVRIGLWLGMLLLDKNHARVDPNFHINSRVGQYDRMLIIERTDTDAKRLNINGADVLAFSRMPSAFTVVINNFFLTKFYTAFLVSRRLGFPFPKEGYLKPDSEGIEFTLQRGIGRVTQPVLRKNISEEGIVLYQPIYKNDLVTGSREFYDDEYVRNNSIDFDRGVGCIFVEENGILIKLDSDESKRLAPMKIHAERNKMILSAISISEWQNWLILQLPKLDLLPKEQKRYVRKRFNACKRVNNILIKHHKSLL